MAKAKIFSKSELKIPDRIPAKHGKNIDKLKVEQGMKLACEDDIDCPDLNDERRKVINLVKRTYVGTGARTFQTRIIKNEAGRRELYIIRTK